MMSNFNASGAQCDSDSSLMDVLFTSSSLWFADGTNRWLASRSINQSSKHEHIGMRGKKQKRKKEKKKKRTVVVRSTLHHTITLSSNASIPFLTKPIPLALSVHTTRGWMTFCLRMNNASALRGNYRFERNGAFDIIYRGVAFCRDHG